MSEMQRSSARDTALEVLMQVSRANAWSDGSLKRTIAKNGLDSREAALCTRLAYGVIQNRGLLDYYIGCWCSQKPHRLEPVILNILRIGGYQILFMDKIPHRAAVNEAVEMTKRWGRPKAAGMVNAVLRKFVANWMDMPALPQGTTADYLSVRYSHPKWLVRRIIDVVGAEETEDYLRMNNEIVPTTIQTNTLKITAEELEKELRAAGVTVRVHPWLAGCFEVSATGDLERLPAFTEGHFTVQDAAARLVATVAAPGETDRVLDMCAAPGGKSFALAIDQKDRGEILSCDVHPHKLSLIERGAERLGIHSVRTALADGRERTLRGKTPPTLWWRMYPAQDLASSGRSRISAIRIPRSWRSCRLSKAPFWTTQPPMCGPAACWCTPPVRCCRRKTRASPRRFWIHTRTLRWNPFLCRSPSAAAADS